MKSLITLILLGQLTWAAAFSQSADPLVVKTVNGSLKGTKSPVTGVKSFKGIPYAKPPVGDLRWKAPQPVENWTGIKAADRFGPRAMQKPIFGDMNFRSDGMGEDCLYLNVWVPARPSKEKLPVLVYFYGGGMVAGDGSEPRYDGESMAQRGIIALTVNYRLGVFGLLAHPELNQESPNHSSGNYSLLDQHAALVWVKENIAAFGGDPDKVTIAGESAGSISVSAQMASPLSKGLISGAIGESGAAINPTMTPVSKETAERNGVLFAEKLNAKTIAELRAIPAAELLDKAYQKDMPPLAMNIDGYFLPKSLTEINNAGEQAHVPLLAGWNSAEIPYNALLWGDEPTPENYAKKVKQLYPEKAAEVLKLYPGNTREEVIASATALASDRFIVYSTWKWADMHTKTSGQPVYRYVYSHPRPPMTPKMGNAQAGLAGGVIKNAGPSPKPQVFQGAPHAAEIEYAMGNLASNEVYAWTKEDYKVSATMQSYFANFIKTGNPNGKGLPYWEADKPGAASKLMDIDVQPVQRVQKDTDRYLFLDKEYLKQ
ncbi:carboxylesterase/lipase family protein [Chitinophaga tropicalis]|uniref:Carboxylic ester hydrolase n=1 Tax=Chitinophaga tropicalis TaxID=2683588 RepID=A0A7K1U568_9BACT|nr:carboxylesterase family protein [Chitinophaga tropicalis]MVT09125.1 carboxylesterase family protein [Chitinophaga tropicalis]